MVTIDGSFESLSGAIDITADAGDLIYILAQCDLAGPGTKNTFTQGSNTYTRIFNKATGHLECSIYSCVAAAALVDETIDPYDGLALAEYTAAIVLSDYRNTGVAFEADDYLESNISTADASTTGASVTPNTDEGLLIVYGFVATATAGNTLDALLDFTGYSNQQSNNYTASTPEHTTALATKTNNSVAAQTPVLNHGNAGATNDLEVFIYLIWIANGNSGPEVPTGLTRTGDTSDTTPTFECSIDDLDFSFSEQAKARFEVRTSALVLVGTIDSAFRSSAGVVSAEYSAALAVGSYKVRAKAIDDAALESAYSAYIDFNVTSKATKDLQIIHDIKQTATKDLQVVYDVKETATKDLQIIYDVTDRTFATKDLEIIYDVAGIATKNLELVYTVYEAATVDLELTWDVDLAWLVLDPGDSIWTPVIPPEYAGD